MQYKHSNPYHFCESKGLRCHFVANDSERTLGLSDQLLPATIVRLVPDLWLVNAYIQLCELIDH